MKNPAGILAFGAHLRQLRQARRWSQRELSFAADIAELTVYRIEKGRLAPTLDVLLSLSRAFQVSVSELVNSPEMESAKSNE